MRSRQLMELCSTFSAKSGDARTRQLNRFLTMIFDEAFDEMAEMGEDKLSGFFHNFALVTEWIATGDYSILPEDLLRMALVNQGMSSPEIEILIGERNAGYNISDDIPADGEVVQDTEFKTIEQ